MKKGLKMIALILLSFILLVLVATTLFILLSPQFGEGPSKEEQKKYSKLPNYQAGKFKNLSDSPMDVNFWRMVNKMIEKAPHRSPKQAITVEKIDSISLVQNQQQSTRLRWFGHSTFLLEMDGKRILIDPMLGDSPSPVPFLGASRYADELPIALEKLPFIDAVILSHDHYDHLDYGSIQKLKDKVGHFYTPLGVGSHLRSWGVAANKINELYWWESIQLDDIHLVCAPARHFSGRGLFDRATTLWCSWIIQGRERNIFFSGDSGYDKHFEEIGAKYGPFDIALVECGQYNQDWKYIHMMPEETVQAAIDLNSQWMMPIHWGAFTLAFHDWTDPVERALVKAEELNVKLTTPKIGEAIVLESENYPQEKWWR